MKKLILVTVFLILSIAVMGKTKEESVYVKVAGNNKAEDFVIGKYEVTQKEYQSILGNNPSRFKGDNLPVEQVTWYDAVMYCNKLSEKEKLPSYYNITVLSKKDNNIVNATVTIVGGKGYRLPTDEEWVQAAEGGKYCKGYTYSGSDNIDKVAWYWINSGDRKLSGDYDDEIFEKNNARTHKIGSKLPNELGIYDMSGNVWEWNETSPKDSNRYSRGGGWDSDSDSCKIFQYEQVYSNAGKNDDSLGFRVCRFLN